MATSGEAEKSDVYQQGAESQIEVVIAQKKIDASLKRRV
jgi:hypothetical protein